MAFKIICDICGQDINVPNFIFEATLTETCNIVDVFSHNSNNKKQLVKKQCQICKECYTKHLEKYFKDSWSLISAK